MNVLIADDEKQMVKILSAYFRKEDFNIIEALSCGADEYVKKPFEPRILILRAKKILNCADEIFANDVRISLNEKQAYKYNKVLNLTKIEYDLLFHLVKNKGITLSRDKLIDLVWRIAYEGNYRTVDTHISRLRNKLGEDFIKTYRRVGYRIEVNENKN